MSAAKVLLVDIETAPNLGYVWGKWEQDVIDIEKHWYILCFSAKWLGEKKVQTFALPDFPKFKKDMTNDRFLMKELWQYFDKADVIVAHNGDRFDLLKANARFISHGLKPPAPYQSVDTLKLARTYFKFDSNRLNDLSKYLGVGAKLAHTGPNLWLGCMRGERRAWRLMKAYNARDVELLEAVYLKLRPWSKRHPNLSYYSRRELNCPVCESPNSRKSGYNYARVSKRQRRVCTDCGHRFSIGGPIAI